MITADLPETLVRTKVWGPKTPFTSWDTLNIRGSVRRAGHAAEPGVDLHRPVRGKALHPGAGCQTASLELVGKGGLSQRLTKQVLEAR